MRSSTRPWLPITPKRKRPGIRSPTTMSISARGNKRSCSMKQSSRSATWRTAAAAPLEGNGLQQLSKSLRSPFQERNPHLRVFNMVLHMDEATPHLHVDFVPVATEQSRGLSTRVSMKQALKQQGFVGLGRNQTEWRAWMEREKGVAYGDCPGA